MSHTKDASPGVSREAIETRSCGAQPEGPARDGAPAPGRSSTPVGGSGETVSPDLAKRLRFRAAYPEMRAGTTDLLREAAAAVDRLTTAEAARRDAERERDEARAVVQSNMAAMAEAADLIRRLEAARLEGKARIAELEAARKIVAEAQAVFLRAAEMGANRVNVQDVRKLLGEIDKALSSRPGEEGPT